MQSCSTAWSPTGLGVEMTASYMITHMRSGLVTIIELLQPYNTSSISLRGLTWTAGRAGCLRMTRGQPMSTTSPGSGRKTTSPKLWLVNCHSRHRHLKFVSLLTLAFMPVHSSVWRGREGAFVGSGWANPTHQDGHRSLHRQLDNTPSSRWHSASPGRESRSLRATRETSVSGNVHCLSIHSPIHLTSQSSYIAQISTLKSSSSILPNF